MKKKEVQEDTIRKELIKLSKDQKIKILKKALNFIGYWSCICPLLSTILENYNIHVPWYRYQVILDFFDLQKYAPKKLDCTLMNRWYPTDHEGLKKRKKILKKAIKDLE